MASAPQRVQLRRTKGWRLPPNTVSVARPSRYGNPHRVIDGNRADAVAKYAADLNARLERGDTSEHTRIQTELRGRNLACYCPPGEPCHVDVLLPYANHPEHVARVLHVYGPRADRSVNASEFSALVLTPHTVRHHTRPWTRVILRDRHVIPRVPMTRGQRAAHLALIAACFIVLGVVVYNTATH